jgi:broad specificity phosphatase PhoE
MITDEMTRGHHAALPLVHLARHGETQWSRTGQHTGRTDLPLTDGGIAAAQSLGARLRSLQVERVFTSPLLRARQTCELAGFNEVAEVDADLLEWDYGDYEGRRTADIVLERPGWELFRDGSPGGESPADIMHRADRLVGRLRHLDAPVLLFSSGHILRAIAVRWLGLPLSVGAQLQLGTASLSRLGYGHDRTEPALHCWNDTSHLERSK